MVNSEYMAKKTKEEVQKLQQSNIEEIRDIDPDSMGFYGEEGVGESDGN